MKNQSSNHHVHFTWATLLFALLSLVCATGTQAANWAWSTAPATSKFADNNWTSGTTPGAASSTPVSGDSLYFGTSSILALTNNDSAFTFAGLTFNSGASAFTITGNAFTLATGSGVTNNSAATQSITNIISGAGNVVQTGAGTLVLSGANTYSAGTIVSAGTLVANTAGALGALGSATVNGTLDLNAGAVNYIGLTNGMSGSGTVNVVLGTGSTTTSLNGNNSGFNGIINLGTNGLTGAVAAAGAGKVQMLGLLGSSAVVNVLANSTLIVNGAITNSAALNLYGGDTGESLGQLRIESAGVWAGPVTLAGAITGGGDGTMGANSGVGTVSGNVTEASGSKQFIKVGNGTLVLSGTNNWTGPTIVNGGTLTLQGNQTNVIGGFYVGTNTAGVGLNIGASTQTVPTTLVVASTNTVLTASGGTAYSGINVNGASGVPTYVTNNGTMSIGRDSGFAVNNFATWVQNSNLTVQANGGYPANFTVSAGGTYVYNGVNPLVISAPVSSGNANINVQGSFFTATNISFNDNGSTGVPYIVLANGGTLTLGNNMLPLFTSTRTNTGPLGQVQVGVNGTLNTAGYSTSITNVIGNASGANGSLVVNGGGSLTLSGFSTYTGGTTVNGGTLVLANGGSPGSGCVRNNLTINSNALVLLTKTDALGYYGGQSVTNININGSTLTNAAGNEGYNASFVLNGGTMSSGGGQYVLYGQSISSLSNSVSSFVNAPILMRGNVLTLSAAAGTVSGGVDLSIIGNLNQYDVADALIKNGAGTILYTGTGNYSGATTINAGSLILAATTSLANTTNFAVAAGATLDVSAISGFTLNYNQGISGGGTVNGSVADTAGSQFSPGGFNTVGTLTITTNLTLAGSDTLNFDFSAGGSNDVLNVVGTLTPNGTTTINLANWPVGGFLQTNYVLIQAASLGGSASSFYLQNVPTGGRQTYAIVYDTSSSPQKVLLQVGGFNVNLVWQGGSGNGWDVQFTQDWLNGATPDYFFTSDNVLFSNVPPANAAVVISGGIQPGSVTFNSTNDYVFTSGYITGTANLVKNGTGSVTLTTANDYTGGTTVNAGTLQLGDGVSVNGSVIGAVANNASLVVSNASSQTINNNLTGSGQTIASGATDLTLSGNIGGAQQVVGNDSGGLILSGTNSYTGGTVVSNGLLIAANATALGVPAAGILATVNGGATLAYHVAGTQTLTNQIVGAGTLAYSNSTPGSLGNGLVGLKLTASNSFAGGLTINVGSVYAYNPHALGTGPVTIDNGNLGGGAYYNQLYVGNGLNLSNAITVVNASDYFNGVLMVDPGPNGNYGASDTNGGTFSGPITIAVGATVQHGGVFCGPGSGTNYLVIAGPVTNLNAGGSITVRNGRTRLSGGGSYGVFNASGGLAQIGANNGICPNATLQIAGGSFDLNGFNQNFNGLANPGAGSISNSSTNNTSTLTLNLSSASTYSSVISGKLNLVLAGSSSLNLTGTNTYTGNTTVNGGTLELAVATLATNSTVTVAGGAVLQLDFATTNQVGSLVTNGVPAGPGVYDSTTGAPFIIGSGSLLVVSTMATYPTNITATVNGSTLTLTWPGTHLGWYAQSNSVNLADPNFWFPIPNSQLATNLIITINPAQANVFYRLSSKP